MKYLLIVLLFMGCKPGQTDNPQGQYGEMRRDWTIVIIDNCEYIEVDYMPGWKNGYYSLTHKGNCKNHSK